MSGPKVSVYTLTAEELAAIQRELLHQQQILLRRAQLLQQAEKCQQKIREQEKSLKSLEFSMAAEKAGSQWVSTEELQSKIKHLQASLLSLNQGLASLTELAYSDENNDEMERQLTAADEKLRMIEHEIHTGHDEAADLQARLAQVLDSEIFGLFETDDAVEADRNAVNTGQAVQGKTAEAKQDKSASRELRPFVKESIQKLLDLKDNPYLPILYQKQVAGAIARMKLANEQHRLAAFCEIELPDILAKCQDFLDLWQSIGQKYQALLLKYETLCDMNGTEQRAAVPFDCTAIAKLKDQIELEESRAEKQAQKAYIQQSLGEVMEEMGYDVIGQRDVQKRNGAHFRNELYQCGEDTAIDVTYADNGQISLELGKTDKEDRLPTPAECSQLENQMLIFCDRFKEMEARLSDKGVIVGNRIALAPPSADYAQIINLEDYHLKARQGSKKTRAVKPKTRTAE